MDAKIECRVDCLSGVGNVDFQRMDTVLPLTAGRKLRLFQQSDPHKQWWSLEELRFCTKCHHLFIGRDIKVLVGSNAAVHFQCPTAGCDGTFVDWEYPQLHL